MPAVNNRRDGEWDTPSCGCVLRNLEANLYNSRRRCRVVRGDQANAVMVHPYNDRIRCHGGPGPAGTQTYRKQAEDLSAVSRLIGRNQAAVEPLQDRLEPGSLGAYLENSGGRGKHRKRLHHRA